MTLLIRQMNNKKIFDESALSTDSVIWCAVLRVLVIAGTLTAFYFWFYEHVGMSLINTLNGVWKVYDLEQYLAGGSGKGGHIWYYSLLAQMVALLELDSLMEYLSLIVHLNGVSAALANAALFVFIHQISQRWWIAVAGVFFHVVMPGNFILSVNNEDIYPAYLFYLLGFFSLYAYFKDPIAGYLSLAAGLFAASMMFHWTMGIPAFGAMSATMAMYLYREKQPLSSDRIPHWVLALFTVAVVLIVTAVVTDTPLTSVIYPSSAVDGSLWLSHFTQESVTLATMNNLFFLWGHTVKNTGLLPLSLSIVIISLLTPVIIRLLIAFRGFRETVANHYASLFLVLVLILGTAMHAFEQGRDLQFTVQPMFIVTFGMTLLLGSHDLRPWHRLIPICLLVFVSVVISLSLSIVRRGHDRSFWNEVEQLVNRAGDMSKAVIVGNSFASMDALVGFISHRPEMIDIPAHWQWDRSRTEEEHGRAMTDTIDSHMSDKDILIVVDLMRVDEKILGRRYLGHDLTDMVRSIRDHINSRYVIVDTTTWRGFEVTFMKACDEDIENPDQL